MFLKGIRQSGGAVNSQIVITTAKGVVTAKDASLLAENSGPIVITKNWAERYWQESGVAADGSCSSIAEHGRQRPWSRSQVRGSTFLTFPLTEVYGRIGTIS